MTVAIALIISLCSTVSMTEVQKKKAELEHQFPDAKVTIRIDKRCTK